MTAPGGAADLDRVARAIGVYVREADDWDSASGDSAATLLDLSACPDAAATDLLDRAAARAQALGPRLVVLFSPDQVDAVAGALLGSGAQLISDPTAPDLAAALSLARAAAPQVGEPSGETAARLLRLAGEVARIADALGGLARGEPAPDERRADYVLEGAADEAPPAAQVRGAIRARRLRDVAFGRGLFEEPAWDMLLDLFAAELEGGQVSVSSLCLASGVAQTTALRWIERMAAAGLLTRRGDPTDRRRAFLSLSERASAGMRRWFAAVRRAGLTT